MIALQPKLVGIGKKGRVYATLLDWQHLLKYTIARPTHVNELVPQEITDVENMDASGSAGPEVCG